MIPRPNDRGSRLASLVAQVSTLVSSSAMSKFSQFIFSAVAIIMLVVGCVRSPKLKQADVVLVASRAATNAGYKIEKYKEPEAHFEFVHKNGTWTVFFVSKPPTPPGGHFLVWVDDKTGKTQVKPGE
jgi:hypothetical protein